MESQKFNSIKNSLRLMPVSDELKNAIACMLFIYDDKTVHTAKQLQVTISCFSFKPETPLGYARVFSWMDGDPIRFLEVYQDYIGPIE